MGEGSKIEWTDHTFNPWWGCARISPGCEHCYAEALAKRYGFGVWGTRSPRRFFGDKHWAEPLTWDRDAERAGVVRRVFCASMADVFESHVEADVDAAIRSARARLFRLIEKTPHLDWILLTKRPELMRELARAAGWSGAWPANVIAMTTAEDQRRAEIRIPHLLRVPASRHGISYEPAIGPLDLTDLIIDDGYPGERHFDALLCDVDTADDDFDGVTLDWVIVGGESGGGARDFKLDWARDVIAQCRGAGVPVFFKQAGAKPHNENGLVKLRNRKGNDLAELPSDLRVREFPRAA